MIGAIAAILIVYWYYKGALAAGKNPVRWAFIGLLVYFIPAIFWTYFINSGLRDSVEHSQNVFLAIVVRYAYVAVGAGCAILYRKKVLEKFDS